MEKVDIKTVHGHIFICDKCKKIHFEFNQIGINFSSINILNNFYTNLLSIDGEAFENINMSIDYIRKIHIPFPNTSIKMLLSLQDLEELKILLATFIQEYNKQEKEYKIIKELSRMSIKHLN